MRHIRLCLKTISRRALARGFAREPAASAIRLISNPRFETNPSSKRAVQRQLVVLISVVLGISISEVAFASGHAPTAETIETDSDIALDVKIRGVELGEYKIRAYYPVDAQKSTVRFVLHAAVATERFAEAHQVVETRRHKLRDEVITATRMTPLAVFDEPGLTSFRRRILVRLRRTLPELPIDDVFVSDFQLTVKSL